MRGGLLCKVNFYSKVPLIISDNTIDFSRYSVEEGSLFELSNTILYTISDKYTVSGLLRKKSKLASLFIKKNKNVSKDTKTVEQGKENVIDENDNGNSK